MSDIDRQEILNAAVNRYLSTITVVGDCLASACPPVGGPYRHQFTRLRTRLAFDPNADSLEESFEFLRQGLSLYAAQASAHLASHRTELSNTMAELAEIVGIIARRQDFHQTRLRKLADQLETTINTGDSQTSATAQKQVLENALESFRHESQSLVIQMFDTIAGLEKRVAQSATTDPVTNLTNRAEMERQIELRKSLDENLVLLRYALTEPIPDEAAREFAIRLTGQFRPQDIIARWSDTEFLVLFQGPPEVAENRVQQVIPWIAGRYPLGDGNVADVQVVGDMYQAELAAA